jgi:hypothetical protein
MRDPTQTEIDLEGMKSRMPRRPVQELVRAFYESGKDAVVVEGYVEEGEYPQRGGFVKAIQNLGLEASVHACVRNYKLVLQRIGNDQILPEPTLESSEKYASILNRPRTCQRCKREGTSRDIATFVTYDNKTEVFCISAINCRIRSDALENDSATIKGPKVERPIPEPPPQPQPDEGEWVF